MNARTKASFRTAVGLAAGIIGFLLTKHTAEENFDKLDNMFTKKKMETEDPLTPPPPAETPGAITE